jgi:hypothetical protein
MREIFATAGNDDLDCNDLSSSQSFIVMDYYQTSIIWWARLAVQSRSIHRIQPMANNGSMFANNNEEIDEKGIVIVKKIEK